ncbi:AMP-dependent synthetase/ligase [Sesbania bispinosa]|nr:AMP-dependent synthetase/ligase [Sesbania bispinosa]
MKTHQQVLSTNAFKDGLLELPYHLQSPWDFFRDSTTRCPNNTILGRRQKIDSKVGPYELLTYQEAYEAAIRMGSAMRSCGVNPGNRCGIYGTNCLEWILAMEACNSYAVTYVRLYDTLGPNPVEFIINHVEVSIAFVQDNKIPPGNLDLDQPLKKKIDICTIMYTSGTTGEPKCVIIKNEALMTEVLSIIKYFN